MSYLISRGSNYLPTPEQEYRKILPYIEKKSTFIDLGFGLGEIMQAAASRDPLRVIGYELNPTRFLKTWWKLRNENYKRYTYFYKDFWFADLSQADVVFTFFVEHHMRKLYKKAKKEMKSGSWLISYRHKVPDAKPTRIDGEMLFFKM